MTDFIEMWINMWTFTEYMFNELSIIYSIKYTIILIILEIKIYSKNQYYLATFSSLEVRGKVSTSHKFLQIFLIGLNILLMDNSIVSKIYYKIVSYVRI